MARVAGAVFDNSRKTPGVPRDSTAVSLAGASVFLIEYTQTQTDFDADNSEYTVEVWLSTDAGQSWKIDTTAKCLGGTRSRAGTMPFVELRATQIIDDGNGILRPVLSVWPVGSMARVRFTTGRNARVGLRSELEIA